MILRGDRRKFKLSKGTARRLLKKDLRAKCLREEKKTRLREKNKEKRVDFCQKLLEMAKEGEIDLGCVFCHGRMSVQNGRASRVSQGRLCAR